MAKAIGLDIGSRAVKLVELDGSAKKHRVSRFVVKEVGEVGGVVETVGAVLKEAGVKKDAVVCALDSKGVVTREILVPFLESDQIRRVLKFEAEAHLHSHAIEDVIVDYMKVGELQDQSKILIFAAPKEKVRAQLDLLRPNGVDPMHVDLDIAALYNASKSIGVFEEHPNCLVLDIGATTTVFLSVKDGEIRACRSLRTGSESITQVISRDLAVDTDSARSRVEDGDRSGHKDDLLAPIPFDEDVPDSERSADELETAIVVQRQDDFLSRLYRETTRSLATTALDESFSAIFLTGAASLSGGIERRLEERFRKPVVRLEFVDEKNKAVPATDYERANASMGIAYGAALKLLDYDGLSMEFRREDLRYTRKFDLIKVPLATTVCLLFVLLFLTWLHIQNLLSNATSEHEYVVGHLHNRYVDETTAKFEKTFEDTGEKAPRLPAFVDTQFGRLPSSIARIKKMHRYITDDLGFNVQGIPPIRSGLEVWKQLSDRLASRRDELGYLRINEIAIDQKRIAFDGLIGNNGNVDLLKVELQKLQMDGKSYVEKVSLGPVEIDTRTNRFKFSVKAELVQTTPE